MPTSSIIILCPAPSRFHAAVLGRKIKIRCARATIVDEWQLHIDIQESRGGHTVLTVVLEDADPGVVASLRLWLVDQVSDPPESGQDPTSRASGLS